MFLVFFCIKKLRFSKFCQRDGKGGYNDADAWEGVAASTRAAVVAGAVTVEVAVGPLWDHLGAFLANLGDFGEKFGPS